MEWDDIPAAADLIYGVRFEQKVTAVSVGYVFSGCSGVETLTGLEQAITSSFTQFGTNLPDGPAES